MTASFGPAEFIIITVMVLFIILIMVLIGVAIRYILAQVTKNPAGAEKRIPCPYCAELILPQAKICRYCGRSVTPQAEGG